jgi:hypothetical protein
MTERLAIPARALLAGDVVGSGETVLRVSAGVGTPPGKVDVTLRSPSGRERGAQWSASTVIRASRPAARNA